MKRAFLIISTLWGLFLPAHSQILQREVAPEIDYSRTPREYYIGKITVDGVKNFKCSCGETKQEIIPAPGHTLNEWSVTPATCTSDGRKIANCKRCAAGFVVELPATGHSWSNWVKKTGLVHSRTCTICGAEEEASHNIPAGSVTCTDCGADIIN